MPQHHLRIRPLRQRPNHLMAPTPRIMIPRQPPLLQPHLPILPNMILIGRKNPRPTLIHIDLQNRQPRRMSRTMSDRQPLRNLQAIAMPRLPIDVELEIVGHVDAEVGFGGDAVEGGFDLGFVYVDGDVGVAELIEAAGVVDVEVADDDGFDVFDVVAGGGDGGLEFVLGFVVYAREEVVDGGSPDFGIVFAGAGFVEDETFGGVGDEDGDH